MRAGARVALREEAGAPMTRAGARVALREEAGAPARSGIVAGNGRSLLSSVAGPAVVRGRSLWALPRRLSFQRAIQLQGACPCPP